jgi:hypothetical protein
VSAGTGSRRRRCAPGADPHTQALSHLQRIGLTPSEGGCSIESNTSHSNSATEHG